MDSFPKLSSILFNGKKQKTPNLYYSLLSFIVLSSFLFISTVQAKSLVGEAYSSFVQGIADSITSDYREIMNVDLQTKQIEYSGQTVTYQYLLWRLRPKSVCANYKHDVLQYSQCGRAAQQLFNETCKYLNENPSDHWKHQKLKTLYCSASVEYRPVIAEAGRSKKEDDESLKQRQQCSVLRMEALRTKDPYTIQMRDHICSGGGK